MRGLIAAALAATLFAGCGGGTSALGPPRISDDIMKGGQYMEPWLSEALAKAEKHPLGARENPVRADMPRGQRAYLARLRCKNGQAPTYERVGNFGAGVFGSIIDGYDVRCEGSEPRRTIVSMDMYFSGYVESRPVNGFTITPP